MLISSLDQQAIAGTLDGRRVTNLWHCVATSMKIRDALESDLTSMAQLLLIVHQLHVDAQPEIYREISLETAVEFLATRMAGKNTYLRVAELESELHAYCSAELRCAPSIPLLRSRESIYLNEIVVQPTSRRRGVGQALMDNLREWTRQRGVDEIELDVGHFNSGAKAFFGRHGFEVLRERMIARVEHK